MRNWETVLGATFAIFAVCIAAWMVGDHFCLNKGEWASWVQAIGSIGAIIGAVLIANHQHRQAQNNAKQAERETHVRVMQVLVVIANDVLRFFKYMAAQGPNIKSGQLSQTALVMTMQNWASQTSAALSEAPVFNLPFADVMQDVVGLKQMVSVALLIQQHPGELKQLAGDPKDFFSRFVPSLVLILYNFTEAEKAVRNGEDFVRADELP